MMIELVDNWRGDFFIEVKPHGLHLLGFDCPLFGIWIHW